MFRPLIISYPNAAVHVNTFQEDVVHHFLILLYKHIIGIF